MLNKLKTALVLVVIGSLSGLIIYGVNELTKDKIVENLIQQERDYYRVIFNLDSKVVIDSSIIEIDGDIDQEITIYDSNDVVIGYIYKNVTKNNYGDITVLVGINLDGTIANVVIASTNNTPTFVNKIKSNYILNFIGQDVDNIEIDSRTGATYTYTSVATTVEFASIYFLESRGE